MSVASTAALKGEKGAAGYAMANAALLRWTEALADEVKGDGVVGNQPVLKRGEHFEYTSGAVLKTPHGSMHGTYRMVTEDGRQFDAEIAPFALVQPGAAN